MQFLIDKLPEYAIDIKKNLISLFIEYDILLTPKQLYGIALSISYSIKHEQVLNSIRTDAKVYLEDSDARACKIAAIMMSMTNTYYGFSKIINDEYIQNMQMGLSLLSLKDHKIEELDFDMYCLGVSIINGCRYCINVHSEKLIKKNVVKEVIQRIGCIVSVLKATKDALEIDRMRTYDFITREEAWR